jgi:glycine dehydrogenase
MPVFAPLDTFARRHLGPSPAEIEAMVAATGAPSLDALVDQIVPTALRRNAALDLPAARGERQALADLQAMADKNEVWRSYLGYGYHDTVTPPVVLRNILENPNWYTAYTPYQAEISQGRLEMLLNFQTMVTELTGMEVANASLLDEPTAAAEAMAMAHRLYKGKGNRFFVSGRVHPHTIAVVLTRAEPLGLEVVVGDVDTAPFDECFGVLVQTPETDGRIVDVSSIAARAHDKGALLVVATDLLACTIVRPPGEMGADVVVGNSQRFGVPLGYGGPHAAFMATKHAFVRQMPGRLIGVSKDASGALAMRMSLGTREQHIRREKATSNICTAQVLLSNTAAAYAVYHGPDGLSAIARRVHAQAATLAEGVRRLGYFVEDQPFFDTIKVDVGERIEHIVRGAAARRINLRRDGDTCVIVALDETVTDADLADLLFAFGDDNQKLGELLAATDVTLPAELRRTSAFLQHPVFNTHKSEHGMLRYLHSLEIKDYALGHGMIPLGSCTMKLNATSEMIPVTWRQWGALHPFAPTSQTQGYAQLFRELESMLCEITGFDAISLQPNAGSQGEFAGLLAIRNYHVSRGDTHRDVCLIPKSAHGTNPASAVMCGMTVVVVECLENGDIDVTDLATKATLHGDKLAALMVTYPSTHGVFEASVSDLCKIVHEFGGQVYMDGANMNAQVGLTRPADLGADVCHLNLHKTFCIPHGGGGPGMGPIGVRKHLAPFLPGHPLEGGTQTGPVSGAPYGSASILVISWAYIAMMGGDGLTEATKVALLAANYVSKRLASAYDTLYVGANGRVAHECILDLRPLKTTSGIDATDVAKRLMDYGFHAPTLSFPVAGTLMVEPTESEPKIELDRFIDAMLAIREEIRAVADGKADKADNALKHAPHTAMCVTDEWTHAYSRAMAVFPTPHTRASKYWPTVRRIDDVYGDRNLVTVCPNVGAK